MGIVEIMGQLRSQIIPAVPHAVSQSIMDLIDSVRRQVKGEAEDTAGGGGGDAALAAGASPSSLACGGGGGGGSLEVMEMIGEGAFAKVFRGLWRGTPVAVKRMVLAHNMSGAEKRERMAIMEAAISSSLSHPNIVQV